MNPKTREEMPAEELKRRLAALSPDRRKLVERLLAKRNGPADRIGPRPADATVIGLSYEQERLWFMNELVDYRAIFHVPTPLRLTGAVDADALERAIGGLVGRHEALRTVFRDDGEGPRQRVLDTVSVPLVRESCGEAADPEREAIQRASESVLAPFDLGAGPLMRCTLYEIGAEDHLLLITQHHIVSDYWSLGILLTDLGALYGNEIGEPVELDPPGLHYPDFAFWQRNTLDQGVIDEQLGYWREQLGDAPELLELPTDRPRPALRTSQGSFHRVEFAAEPVARMRALAKEESTTLLVTFLAAYFALLSRLTRQDVIVVGVPVAGRSRSELQRMVGYFLNWLSIKVRVDDRPSLRELVARTNTAMSEAMARQDVPFDKLVRELGATRLPGVTPIFQTSFSLRDGAPQPPQLPGVDATFADLDGGATHFDLMAELWGEEDRVVGYLPFDEALFDEETVDAYATWLERLMDGGTAEPDRAVATLPLVGDDEGARLAAPPRLDFGPVEDTLHGRFAEQVRLRDDAIAVCDETARLGYGELDALANRIARVLQDAGVAAGCVVGVMLERNVDLVAGILAVLKCGAAYLPIDPENPAARTGHQLADCAATTVLVTPDLVDRLPEDLASVTLLDREAPGFAGASSAPLSVCVPADAPAYVIYTSGSTGAPKGVVVSHANVLRLLDAALEHFSLGTEDVWTLFHSSAFDFSVWELWGALALGGRLVVVPQWITRAPDEFARLIEEERVTVLSQTPSAFGQLSRVLLETDGEDALRYVVFGGEALDHATLRDWFAARGDERPELINMYGITETTVHVTFRRVTRADLERRESLIGEPLADLSLYLLDEERQPVPAGIPGEMYVGGAGVALGYQGAGALTAQRMLPDPFTSVPGSRMYRTGDRAVRLRDGELAYRGRIDAQRKIRGHRIEPGEIQHALGQLTGVAESAVLITEDRNGGAALAAYVVAAAGHDLTSTQIRRDLLRTLPDWMIPSSISVLDELPLTRNGKLDRQALLARERTQARDRVAAEPPEGETATALARIWEELLGVAGVGAQDDFFDLGGHSLMVVQLVSTIRATLGVEVPIETIFYRSRLQAMADALDATAGDASAGEPVPPAASSSDAARAELAPAAEDIAARVAELGSAEARRALPLAEGDTVLLTGATGFVGAFVLSELLSRGAPVVCLLPGGNARREELVERLRALDLWSEENGARLELVAGDLAEPRLGIADAEYDALSHRVAHVVHAAAQVNDDVADLSRPGDHIYPYEHVAEVNAHSAGRLLDFASTHVRKGLTLISPGAVFDSADPDGGAEFAAAPIVSLAPESNGYVRSKGVAELYLAHAGSVGVPASIVRIPSVFGDRRSFQTNPRDALWSWSKAIIATGRYPASFGDNTNELFQALPADVVARVIADVARDTVAAGCRIVNAIPNRVCPTTGLLDGMRAAGHDPQPAEDREWYAQVAELDTREIWAAGLAAQIAQGDPGRAGDRVASNPAAQAATRALESARRARLHRFTTVEEPEIARLVDAEAITSADDVASYIRSLTPTDADHQGPRAEPR